MAVQSRVVGAVTPQYSNARSAVSSDTVAVLGTIYNGPHIPKLETRKAQALGVRTCLRVDMYRIWKNLEKPTFLRTATEAELLKLRGTTFCVELVMEDGSSRWWMPDSNKTNFYRSFELMIANGAKVASPVV